MPEWFKHYVWHVLAVLIFVGSTALATWVAMMFGGSLTPVPIPPPPPVVVAPADEAPPNAFGWVNDPQEVRVVSAEMGRPVFAATPAGTAPEPLPDHAYLWEAYGRLFGGKLPPPQDQNPVGSCVSFGSSRAYERSLACQIVAGDSFEFRHLCEEAIYALSRVEIGGGRIRGDGSVGAWAAKGFTKFGGLPRGIYGRYDLTRYDPARCRSWGNSGLPNDLETEAQKYPAGDCAQVRNFDEAKRALAQGFGVFVCSDQGFTRQRDGNGVCSPQGVWQHCMCLDGYHRDANGKEYGHIENSWGPDYHVGPVGWGSPSTAGFWAEARVVDRMLQQGDSWAVSAVKGFPRKKLDWFALDAVENRHAPDHPVGRPRGNRPGLALAW